MKELLGEKVGMLLKWLFLELADQQVDASWRSAVLNCAR